MKACLSGETVTQTAKHISYLIDHRYFYDEFDPARKKFVARYTCGVARNAVAAELRANNYDFADEDFLRSLPRYINNPSMAGFMMEQAIISWIAKHGLYVGSLKNKKMEVIVFAGDYPKWRTDITKQPVLYYPKEFNFPAIDGIIVLIGPKPRMENKKQDLFMFPFQITLALDSHSSSHKIFFSQYQGWIEGLEQFNVVPEFLWISPKAAQPKSHAPSDENNWPAYIERPLELSKVSEYIGNYYKDVKRRQQIQGALGERAGGDGQGRSCRDHAPVGPQAKRRGQLQSPGG